MAELAKLSPLLDSALSEKSSRLGVRQTETPAPLFTSVVTFRKVLNLSETYQVTGVSR